MPNKKTKKRLRLIEQRTLANKIKRSQLRTWVRKLNEAVAARDKDAAVSIVPMVFKKIDKAAKTGCIHKNTAARRKALVSRRVASLG